MEDAMRSFIYEISCGEQFLLTLVPLEVSRTGMEDREKKETAQGACRPDGDLFSTRS